MTGLPLVTYRLCSTRERSAACPTRAAGQVHRRAGRRRESRFRHAGEAAWVDGLARLPGVLDDEHDAEDAFQNAFLVLARRAGSLWRQDSVGPWLHGVAFRVAQHSRSAVLRRRRREQAHAPESLAIAQPDQNPGHHEIGPAVNEEIGRLPAHYRGAVVLCYLEGKSHEQAAVELNCPVGTIKSRLLRARARLSGRLERRGVAPALWVCASLEQMRPATAIVPKQLAELTVRAAAGAVGASHCGVICILTRTMAHGGLKAMFANRLKWIASVVVAISLTVTGATALAWARSREPSAGSNVRDPVAVAVNLPVAAPEPATKAEPPGAAVG